jgi:hypothetical protein
MGVKCYVKSIVINPTLQLNWYVYDHSSAYTSGFHGFLELSDTTGNNAITVIENYYISNISVRNDSVFVQFCTKKEELEQSDYEDFSQKRQDAEKILRKKGLNVLFVYDGVWCDIGNHRVERLNGLGDKPHFFNTDCDEHTRYYEQQMDKYREQ